MRVALLLPLLLHPHFVWTALAAKCPKWCDQHKSGWKTKCRWHDCDDCPPCGEPQQAVGRCGYNCDKNQAKWQDKCYWDACSGCKECAPPCKPWCAKHQKSSWTAKCGWENCGGCLACPPYTNPTAAPTVSPTGAPTVAPPSAPPPSTPPPSTPPLAYCVDPKSTLGQWQASMDVYDNPAAPCCGGGYIFSSAWDLADGLFTVDNKTDTITLQPNCNTYNAADGFWSDGNGNGNKIMRANLYQESSDLDRALSSFSNVVTFSGVVVSNTLDAAYTAKAFIRALNPGGQNALAGSVPFVPLGPCPPPDSSSQ